MRKEDWHFHLLIFFASLVLCITGFITAQWGYSTDSEAYNLAAIAKAITGSALFIVGATGILLQYVLYIKFKNK